MLSQGALIAKLDIESAYRIVPVHPDDRSLLGIQWKGATYIDAMASGQRQRYSLPSLTPVNGLSTAEAHSMCGITLMTSSCAVPRHQQSVQGHSTLPSPPVVSWVCLSLHTKSRGQQQTSPSWGYRSTLWPRHSAFLRTSCNDSSNSGPLGATRVRIFTGSWSPW